MDICERLHGDLAMAILTAWSLKVFGSKVVKTAAPRSDTVMYSPSDNWKRERIIREDYSKGGLRVVALFEAAKGLRGR